ncbi:Membrane protein [Streptococcus pneumoniae]|nr:Membrane protein [Streptococcus pneumoniae]
MELVLPNNYVVIDEEVMMYLDGGAYLSKRACQGICAAGKIAYCIGYGVLNRGCDINGNPYPWDGFISATVR